MRFLGRAPRSDLPNSQKRSVDRDDLVKSRMEKQIKLAEKKGRQSRNVFKNGDKVLLRCPKTKRWVQEGLVVQEKNSDNGVPVSFVVELDSGHRTIRHKSHMRHSIKSEEKISEKQVRFGPRVEYSDGSHTQAESTHDKPDRPMTRLRAALREKHRTVWPSQH